MNGMQQEIDQLKANVADVRKNIGFDDELFDDLDDFDKKVSESLVLEDVCAGSSTTCSLEPLREVL